MDNLVDDRADCRHVTRMLHMVAIVPVPLSVQVLRLVPLDQLHLPQLLYCHPLFDIDLEAAFDELSDVSGAIVPLGLPKVKDIGVLIRDSLLIANNRVCY